MKKVISRRGEASGQNLLDKSRQLSPRCFAPTAYAEYSVNSLSETTLGLRTTPVFNGSIRHDGIAQNGLTAINASQIGPFQIGVR